MLKVPLGSFCAGLHTPQQCTALEHWSPENLRRGLIEQAGYSVKNSIPPARIPLHVWVGSMPLQVFHFCSYLSMKPRLKFPLFNNVVIHPKPKGDFARGLRVGLIMGGWVRESASAPHPVAKKLAWFERHSNSSAINSDNMRTVKATKTLFALF